MPRTTVRLYVRRRSHLPPSQKPIVLASFANDMEEGTLEGGEELTRGTIRSDHVRPRDLACPPLSRTPTKGRGSMHKRTSHHSPRPAFPLSTHSAGLNLLLSLDRSLTAAGISPLSSAPPRQTRFINGKVPLGSSVPYYLNVEFHTLHRRQHELSSIAVTRDGGISSHPHHHDSTAVPLLLLDHGEWCMHGRT